MFRSRIIQEAKIYILCALLVARSAIYAGAITFLAAYSVILMDIFPVAQGTEFLLAALGFVVGGLHCAKRILDMTSPRRLACCRKTRARVWVWPFLLCAWAAIALSNPYLMLLGILSEGFMAAYYKQI